MVGTAAGFHHHQADGAVGKPALELGAREALLLNDPPAAIGDGELEDGLRQIDSHDGQCGSSIHLGLLLVER